jgi:4-aminobutyrate--pyruvate transaminase
LIGGVELVRDRSTKESFDPSLGAARRVCLAALEQGVIFRPLAGDVVAISPPFVVSDEQIDRMVMVLGRAIAQVEKELKAGA